MRVFGILAMALVLGSCGGSSRPPMKPAFAAGAEVRITDGGQIYDALNTTDCVKWPDAETKKKAGRTGWGGFDPGTGNEGKVMAALAHCDGKTQVVLVAVGKYVVPVTSLGVEASGGDAPKQEEVGELVGLGGMGYGGSFYGGYLYGEGDSWGVVGTMDGASAYYPGDPVEIIDAGEIFTDINEGDCISWPDEETKKLGGQKSWGTYYPAAGDVGYVLHITYRCSDNVEILILDVGGHVVPIKSSAVTLTY